MEQQDGTLLLYVNDGTTNTDEVTAVMSNFSRLQFELIRIS